MSIDTEGRLFVVETNDCFDIREDGFFTQFVLRIVIFLFVFATTRNNIIVQEPAKFFFSYYDTISKFFNFKTPSLNFKIV